MTHNRFIICAGLIPVGPSHPVMAFPLWLREWLLVSPTESLGHPVMAFPLWLREWLLVSPTESLGVRAAFAG